jgi:hypothetical protein
MPHAESAGDIAEDIDPGSSRERMRHGSCVAKIGESELLAFVLAPEG